MSDSPAANSVEEFPENKQVRNNIFISYSHRDAESDNDWYREVETYLGRLGNLVKDDLDVWSDKKIKINDKWHDEIDHKLKTAQAAILLISPSFFNSQYIFDYEVPQILERHAGEGLKVYPLFCKMVPLEGDNEPLAKFILEHQLVTPPDKPLSVLSGPEREKILTDLVNMITKDLKSLQRFKKTRRDEFMERTTQAIKELGITLSHEVASGDTSMIYLAKNAWSQEIAVKTMISIPISEAGVDEIKTEWQKSQQLKHPCFIRIHNVTIDKWLCTMIADYVRGQPLDVKYRALKQRAIKQNRPWTDVITMLMMELAEAAAEGHAAELCYLSFDPANILIEDKYDRPRLYPVDFSAWIASIGQQVGTLRIPLDSLIYYAPELFEYTSLGVHDPHSCRHDIAKANQYALGMVALTLLQEGPPLQFRCLGDLPKLQKFHQDPRGFSASESEQDRLENSPWRRTAPALARVIWRMLERDPARRWDNMQEVAQQLRAVITSSANISTHVSQAKYCYVDHVAGKDDFYHRFYDCFFELSPDSRSHFANVNWKRQCQLLDNAIERLLNYRPVQNEPTTLTCIAKSHSHIGIDENEFEHFAQAFLDTLKSIPEFDIDTQFAWEAVLWPGIEYIKNMSRSTPENPPPTPCKAGKTGKTGAQKAGRKSGKSAKK